MNLKRHHVLYGLLAVSLIIALIVFLTPGTSGVSYTASTTPESPVVASSTPQNFRFEVVTTAAAQEQGLGGRADVPENYGMLFVFQKADTYGFWMKDMEVPIDIIWLSNNGSILGIVDSISPSTYPNAVYPPSPVEYVLETRAGEARRQGWAVGSRVPLPSPYGS